VIVPAVYLLYIYKKAITYLTRPCCGGVNLDDMIDLTALRIEDIVSQHGSISLSRLEYSIDASYNLIFLAVERLVAKGNIRLNKVSGDYIISLPANKPGTGSHFSLENQQGGRRDITDE